MNFRRLELTAGPNLLAAALIPLWAWAAQGADSSTHTLAEVNVFPSSVELSTKRDRQSLVVQAMYSDGITRDVTRLATYAFAPPAIAKLDNSTVFPVAD